MATPVTRVHQPTRAQAFAWELGAFLRHLCLLYTSDAADEL